MSHDPNGGYLMPEQVTRQRSEALARLKAEFPLTHDSNLRALIIGCKVNAEIGSANEP
jgi:hypothetical protein